MTAAAEDVAGEGELPGFVGREANDARLTGLDLHADVEIRQAESMLHVFGLDLKRHRFALFYGDLAGHELKLFRGDMNYFLARLRRRNDGSADSGSDCRKDNEQPHTSFFHLCSSF